MVCGGGQTPERGMKMMRLIVLSIAAGSLLRRFSVVITFVLGAVFFHERNLRRKAIALAAILAGVALLCVT